MADANAFLHGHLSDMVDLSVSVKRSGWGSDFRQFLDLLGRCEPAAWRSLLGDICVLLALSISTSPVCAQTSAAQNVSASPVAVVKSFRVVQEKDGPALEILSTKPLVPAIHALVNPPRLVIDLPNAKLGDIPKRITVQADQISTLRGDQFQANPPVARIVLDLETALPYTWDAAGNRLVVHLGKNARAPNQSQTQALSAPSLTPSSQPTAVASVRTSQPITVSQNSLTSGSTIAAANDTVVLGLTNGGEVHVCPGTTVSVTASQGGHNVMFGMSTGAMEAHFALDASSDSIITPDFRILLTGPGQFHYAFSSDHQGNTCVRSLPGNTASVMVSELMGDRTYQVKATDQLVFRSGQLDRVDMSVPLECGCPPPPQPTLQATKSVPVAKEAAPQSPLLASAGPSAEATALPRQNRAPSTLPAPELATNHSAVDLHVQIEAPFVVRATGPPPLPMEEVRALPLESRRLIAPALSAPLPPPPSGTQKPSGTETASANPAPSRGFFRKLGHFFAAIFR